jgi:hypothetical protein
MTTLLIAFIGYLLCVMAIVFFIAIVGREWIGFHGRHSRSELHSKWRYRK